MTHQRDQLRRPGRFRTSRGTTIAATLLVGATLTSVASFAPGRAVAAPRVGLTHEVQGFAAQQAGLGVGSGPLHVAALGDSVPAGHGARSFVNTVGDSLAREVGRTLDLDNEAVSGSTSEDALQAISDPNSAAAKAVASADVTIVEIGANDFDSSSAQDPSCAPVQTSGCYSDDMASMKNNVQTLLADVKKLSKPKARVVVVGYWNDFEDGSVGQAISDDYVAQGRALARWTNSTLKSLADQDGFVYADIYTPFFANNRDVTSLLQSDGDHPNAAGHQLIADTVLEALSSTSRV